MAQTNYYTKFLKNKQTKVSPPALIQQGQGGPVGVARNHVLTREQGDGDEPSPSVLPSHLRPSPTHGAALRLASPSLSTPPPSPGPQTRPSPRQRAAAGGGRGRGRGFRPPQQRLPSPLPLSLRSFSSLSPSSAPRPPVGPPRPPPHLAPLGPPLAPPLPSAPVRPRLSHRCGAGSGSGPQAGRAGASDARDPSPPPRTRPSPRARPSPGKAWEGRAGRGHAAPRQRLCRILQELRN